MFQHDILFNEFIFPTTKAVKDTKPIFRAKYKCDEKNNCDFSEAIEQIQSNMDLQSFTSRDDINRIVIDIQNHQSDYIPAMSDGFIITKLGFHLVLLENEIKRDTVTGLVDIDSYKFKLREEAQKKAFRAQIRTDLNNKNHSNTCSII